MKIEWDPVKAAKNLKKHKVTFDMASTVFDDSLSVSILENGLYAEQRWVTLGLALNHQILVVIHTYKLNSSGKEILRIISARIPTPKERRQYEKGI